MFLLNFIPWYLGNKYKLLSNIEKEILRISSKWNTICDLFAWSWIIGDFLKSDYKIIANDIEYYSYIINRTILNFDKDKLKKINLGNILSALDKKLQITGLKREIEDISKYLQNISNRKPSKDYFFYNNFAGSYFSINQCLEVDFYRLYIEKKFKWFEKDYLIALGIFWLNAIVNSVWSHFAQPRLPKDKNLKIIENKYKKSFYDIISRKHNEVMNHIKDIKIFSKENKVYNMDYNFFLGNSEKIDVFYIDTPYTIDHYSRFYHIINTFSKYDYPAVEGKWLYRKDRFQSNFCIKTKVKSEFDNMISKIKKNYNAKIVLSYSDSYRSLISKTDIDKIFKKYYKNVKIVEIKYNYSWFWQSSWNSWNELLFIASC